MQLGSYTPSNMNITFPVDFPPFTFASSFQSLMRHQGFPLVRKFAPASDLSCDL